MGIGCYKKGQNKKRVIEYVTGTTKIAKLGDKPRGTRLHWYGHWTRAEERRLGWKKNDRDGNTW